MMYLLFNQYGVIKDKQINEWIVQGSNNVNKIGVAIDGVDSTSFALVGVCKLPNGEVITTAPVDEQAEIIDGVYGVVFSLSKDITALEGTLRINIQAINTSTDKIITSYTVFLCVNEGVDPGEIVMMTADQYQDLLSKIELDVQNDETILTFNALPLASNYSVGQVIYIHNENTKKLYECVSNNDTLEWHETFNFNDYYTKAEIDTTVGNLEAAINTKSTVSGTVDNKGKWNSLTIDGMTHDVGGSGGADYQAGTGISISDDTISVDFSEVASVSSVEAIESLIPAQASSSNKLADKNFVNSSIATNTANFLGTYNLVTDLSLTTSATHEQIASAIATKLASESITPTNNDYVFVAYPDATVSTQYTQFDRYKYNSEQTAWEWEYTLNNSSFTADQWAAINSGITATLVGKIVTIDTNQTITGQKTIKDTSLTFEQTGQSAKYNIIEDYGDLLIKRDNAIQVEIGLNSIYLKTVKPLNDNTNDIGQSNLRWKDAYFAGQVYAQNTYNIINATDITNNGGNWFLNETDLAKFANGKLTRINGFVLSYYNYLFTQCSLIGGYLYATGFAYDQNLDIKYICWQINATTGQIGVVANSKFKTNKLTVQDKNFPDYPSSPTISQVLKYLTNDTLAYGQPEAIETQSTGGATSINLKKWVGTQAQYDSITTKDANTEYIII